MIKKITGCGLSIFWGGVIAFGYSGVMSAYWQQRFSVGSAEIGLIITFMLLALAVAMFFSGKVHAKVGMAKCVVIGAVLYVLAFGILLMARNIYWIYAWGFVGNLGCSFIYGPGLTTVQRACPEKKGLVSGILNLIFGVSAAIMSPILNMLLELRGYLFVNLFVLVLIVLTNLVAFVLLHQAEKVEEVGAAGPVLDMSGDLSVGDALRTKQFWLIWFLWAFMGASGISMISLSKSYTLALGLTGVTILTAFNLANGCIRIFVGMLTDKIGAKITGMAAFALAGLGYLLMPYMVGIPMISLCAICVGIGFGTLFTVTGPMASELFGLKNFGMIFGLIFTAYGMVGGIVGPAVSGLLLERTGGDYGLVFTYLGVMALIGVVLMGCIKVEKIRKV